MISLYLLANVAYLVTLPFQEIQNAAKDRVATAAMDAIFPAEGGKIMAAAIMVSTFGCVNGLILAGARAYYSMARDGLFFAKAGQAELRQGARLGARHPGDLGRGPGPAPDLRHDQEGSTATSTATCSIT